MHISDLGIIGQNLLKEPYYSVIIRNFPRSSQPLPDGASFFYNDSPLAFIVSSGISVAAYTQVVRVSSVCRRKFPSPVFLIGSDCSDVFSSQTGSKPSGQVLAETTRIYKVFTHLRQIETARLEKNTQGIHRL